MDLLFLIALTSALAWCSGVSLYLTLFVVAFLANTGLLPLPPGLHPMADATLAGLAAFAFTLEFAADKFSGFDTVWDRIHLFIRIPGAALLAGYAVAHVGPLAMASAALAGAGLATLALTIKAGGRIVMNEREPALGQWQLSLLEHLLVVLALSSLVYYPWLSLAELGLLVITALWLMPRVWSGVRRYYRFLLFWRPPPPPTPGGHAGPPTYETPGHAPRY